RSAIAVRTARRKRCARRIRETSTAVHPKRGSVELERAGRIGRHRSLRGKPSNFASRASGRPDGGYGFAPGQRNGCKRAVVNETGKFLENQTIHLTEPKQDLEGSEKTLLDLIQKHNVRGIAIGNGTGSREADSFVRTVIDKNKVDIFVV